MRIHKSTYDGNDKWLTVLPSGCWHIGHINCRYDIIEDWVNKLDYNHRGILLGDLGEFATKTSIGKGLYDTIITPNKQIELITKILKPKKEFIDGCVKGNHETRIENLTSIDILKIVCSELDIPYFNYNGIVKYSWNGVAYSFNMWHGAGCGSTPQTAIKTCEEMSNRSFSDVYVIAHFHKNLKSDKLIDVPDLRNMIINQTEQNFVTIGSALDYDEGYADMNGLQPRKLGWPEIYLHGVKKKKAVKILI